MALYRKYRPSTFAEVIGQDHVTVPLGRALDAGRINHAYLFSGPRGCGKTSSARILARSLNCEKGPTSTPCGECASCVALGPGGGGSLDVTELDAASHRGVDDMRELRDRAIYAPAESRYRVFIIDEAHMITKEGFNALLKIVEEPPAHLVFIFATTEPEKVITTIRSRTHHYPFRLLAPNDMRGLLERICKEEGVPVEDSVYPLVIRAGGGSPRDSLSVLDQLVAGAGPEGITYQLAASMLGVTDSSLIDSAIDALAAHSAGDLFRVVDQVLAAGHDPRRFASDLLDRLRDVLVVQAVPDAMSTGLVDVPAQQWETLNAEAAQLPAAAVTHCAQVVSDGLNSLKGATSPRLLLEIMCARMVMGSGAQAVPVQTAGAGQTSLPAQTAAAIPAPSQAGPARQTAQPGPTGHTAPPTQPTQPGQTAQETQASQPAQTGQQGSSSQPAQPVQAAQATQASQPAQTTQPSAHPSAPTSAATPDTPNTAQHTSVPAPTPEHAAVATPKQTPGATPGHTPAAAPSETPATMPSGSAQPHASSATSAGPVLSVDEFNAAWPAIRDALSQRNRRAHLMMAEAVPLAAQGSLLILGHHTAMLVERLNSADHNADITAAIAAATGKTVRTVTITGTDDAALQRWMQSEAAATVLDGSPLTTGARQPHANPAGDPIPAAPVHPTPAPATSSSAQVAGVHASGTPSGNDASFREPGSLNQPVSTPEDDGWGAPAPAPTTSAQIPTSEGISGSDFAPQTGATAESGASAPSGAQSQPAPTPQPGAQPQPAPTQQPGTQSQPAPTPQPGAQSQPAPTPQSAVATGMEAPAQAGSSSAPAASKPKVADASASAATAPAGQAQPSTSTPSAPPAADAVAMGWGDDPDLPPPPDPGDYDLPPVDDYADAGVFNVSAAPSGVGFSDAPASPAPTPASDGPAGSAPTAFSAALASPAPAHTEGPDGSAPADSPDTPPTVGPEEEFSEEDELAYSQANPDEANYDHRSAEEVALEMLENELGATLL